MLALAKGKSVFTKILYQQIWNFWRNGYENSQKTDLTQGPIFRSLFVYSLPMVITNITQILFHAADVAVLGIMATDAAVAAVGACGYLITLLVSLFTGLAAGANVLISKRVGAKDQIGSQQAVGTSLSLGLISGLILMIIALFGAEQFLIWIKCDPAVLTDAALYLRVYFSGMPVLMLYNFVAGILRSVGDSIRPMAHMLIAGVLNVVLNVVFVALLDLTVAGVALATILSQLVALILALIALSKNQDYCKVQRSNLRIRKNEAMAILQVGIPASLCGIFFYIGNLVLSSAVNQMGTDAMAANTISAQFDNLIYQVGASIAVACMVMVGQNVGAANIRRVKSTMRVAAIYATAISLSLGCLFYFASDFLCGLLTDSQAVVDLAKNRMTVLCFTYFTTTLMEILAFSLRSLGQAKVTMIVGATTGLLGRCLWTYFVFPVYPSIGWLFTAYFATSILAILIYYPVYRFSIRSLSRQLGESRVI